MGTGDRLESILKIISPEGFRTGKFLVPQDLAIACGIPPNRLLEIDNAGRISAQKEQEVIVAFSLESMPKPVLYMVLSELRRVIPKDGNLWLASRNDASTFKEKFHYWIHKLPHIHLHHFLSPEDWKIEQEEALVQSSERFLILKLKRLPEL